MAAAARARGLARFELVEQRIEDAVLSAPFDAVVASMSLDHVADLAHVLARVTDVLAPRGRMIVSTEHPVRTAPLSGTRWTGDGAARLRDYGSGGLRHFRWFGLGQLVPVYHRTFEAWLDAFGAAGLRVVAIREPISADERDSGVPRFVLFVAEKQGPRVPIVTVDGPAGAGKSTLAAALAQALSWSFFDTGTMVRALAWRRLRRPGSREPLVTDAANGWRCGEHDLHGQLDADDVLAACPAVANDPALSDEGASLLAAAMAAPVVLAGRALGRTLAAGTRIWLDTPLRVRAERRRIGVEALQARDDADRTAGRLLDPDVAALHLDGERTVAELVESAMRAVGVDPPNRVVPSLPT